MPPPLTLYLVQRLGAAQIENVVQIVGIQRFTIVPEAPYYMKGLVNIRNEIIPVVDLRLRIAVQGVEYNDRTSIIIVVIKERKIGLVVDEVSEVARIPLEKFADTNNDLQEFLTEYISSISIYNNNTILHLELEKLFDLKEISQATAV
jgi:purine-binding chemotaxis protein CheW